MGFLIPTAACGNSQSRKNESKRLVADRLRGVLIPGARIEFPLEPAVAEPLASDSALTAESPPEVL